MPRPCRYLGGGNTCKSNANIDRAWAGRAAMADGRLLPGTLSHGRFQGAGGQDGGAGCSCAAREGWWEPSPWPLHPHCHPVLIFHPIAAPSLFRPRPHCHPVLISTPLPPCPHPIPIATPSRWPPHPDFHPVPIATPLCPALTGVPSRLSVPAPPDAAAPCHTIMSLAECNGESSRCLCFSCSPHSCHFQ